MKRTSDSHGSHDNDVLYVSADGTPFTEADAQKISDDFSRDDFDLSSLELVWTKKSGRPPLFGQIGTSPQITFRLPHDLRQKAVALAEQRQLSLSQLTRLAVEELVNSAIPTEDTN